LVNTLNVPPPTVPKPQIPTLSDFIPALRYVIARTTLNRVKG
jgi:hypothetical protein